MREPQADRPPTCAEPDDLRVLVHIPPLTHRAVRCVQIARRSDVYSAENGGDCDTFDPVDRVGS
jgi:hypothetical protein